MEFGEFLRLGLLISEMSASWSFKKHDRVKNVNIIYMFIEERAQVTVMLEKAISGYNLLHIPVHVEKYTWVLSVTSKQFCTFCLHNH